MTVFRIFALLLTFAALGGYINRRFLRLPATVGLMTVALLISLAALGLERLGLIDMKPATAAIARIDFSGLLLHGMLSFLLFAGALHVDLAELRKFRAVVAVLATVSTALAVIATGILIHYMAAWLGVSLTWIEAFLFGAVVAPTDAVAVLGILKETSASKSLRIKIGGESLFNDGVGVVIFLVLLATASGKEVLAPATIAILLAWEGIASVVLGLTLGWIAHLLLDSIDDYKLEVMLTLALVAGGYSLAEAIYVSGPITMVVAGLVIGNHSRMFAMSARTRANLDLFWELLDEILNALLFMLMGFEMMVISFSSLHLALGLFAVLAVLAGRYFSVALPVSLMRRRYMFEKGTVRLLTWGGLRGGISIAMALALPPGPHKELFLAMTYAVVAFSILFQGTTFRYAVRAIVGPGAPAES